MTREIAIALERLAHATGATPRAVEKLRETWQEFRRALNAEDHVAIMSFDDDLTCLLRGHVLGLADSALRERDPVAEILIAWADKGVPRTERETLIDILIAVPTNR